MPGRGPMKQALSKLEEVRDMIRQAEVELRESAYHPHAARAVATSWKLPPI